MMQLGGNYSRSFRDKLVGFLDSLLLTEEAKGLVALEATRGILKLSTSKPQALRILAHKFNISDDLTHFKFVYLDVSYYVHTSLWVQIAKHHQNGTAMSEEVAKDWEYIKTLLQPEDFEALSSVATNDHLNVSDLDFGPEWTTGQVVKRNLKTYIKSKMKPINFLHKYDPMWGKEDCEQNLTAELVKLRNIYQRSPQRNLKNTGSINAKLEFQRYAEVSLNLGLRGMQSYYSAEPRRRVKSTIDDLYVRRRDLKKVGADSSTNSDSLKALKRYSSLASSLESQGCLIRPSLKAITLARDETEVRGLVVTTEEGVKVLRARLDKVLEGVVPGPAKDYSPVNAVAFFLNLGASCREKIQQYEAIRYYDKLVKLGAVTHEWCEGQVAFTYSPVDSVSVQAAKELVAAFTPNLEYQLVNRLIQTSSSDYFSMLVPLRHYGHEEGESHERELTEEHFAPEASGMFTSLDPNSETKAYESGMWVRDTIKKVQRAVQKNQIERRVLAFVRAVIDEEDMDPGLVKYAAEKRRDLGSAQSLIGVAKQFYQIKPEDLKNPHLLSIIAEHRMGESEYGKEGLTGEIQQSFPGS